LPQDAQNGHNMDGEQGIWYAAAGARDFCGMGGMSAGDTDAKG
jgi:hypothetical protein